MMFNWLSVVTGFFYIVLGIFVFVRKWFLTDLEEPVAYSVGVLMVLYGIFRIIRAIYRIKQAKNERNEE